MLLPKPCILIYCLSIHILLYSSEFYELEPIQYLEQPGTDSVRTYFSQTSKPWETWNEDPEFGYLPAFLETFNIPKSSQVLVYSKTSFQISHIHPETPRAIYFNDEIYLGKVIGSNVLEISVASPENGTNFYTLSPQQGKPNLYRETHDCLQCHGGSRTRSIPGHLIRSVFTKEDGHAILKAGSDIIDLSVPFEKRFGGWYVTGLLEQPHRGNQIFKETYYGADAVKKAPLLTDDGNLNSRQTYASSSDIIAHLILQHQAQVHNAMAKLTLMTQKAIYDQKVFDELLHRDGTLVESTLHRIHHAADDLIEALFFYNEAKPFPEVARESTFRTYFERLGPFDQKDRTLRKLDLHTRLFRYPMSYLIYSDSFLKLPETAKKHVVHSIKTILNSKQKDDKFSNLRERDKTIILSILTQTHPDFKS